MKNITVNIPEAYDEAIQTLKTKKRVASRSEAIRMALKQFLKEEIGFYLKLEGYE
jgi:Arc/MetJ-type ribon-helix-helix transcriptional regulator